MFCKLKKYLYGLKHTPCQWNKRFDVFMLNIDFTKSSFGSCMYLKELLDISFVYLLLHVDNMLITAEEKVEVQKINDLRSDFDVKDLGGVAKKDTWDGDSSIEIRKAFACFSISLYSKGVGDIQNEGCKTCLCSVSITL